MKRAQIGEYVTICPYDWYSDDPLPDDPRHPGQYLRTIVTRGIGGGTVYLIREIRRASPRKRLPLGVRARYSIRAVKLGNYADIDILDGGRVLTLKWNERKRRKA